MMLWLIGCYDGYVPDYFDVTRSSILAWWHNSFRKDLADNDKTVVTTS